MPGRACLLRTTLEAGSDPMAYNDPDQPPRVKIEKAAVQGISDKLSVAPCSATLLVISVD